MGNIVGEPFKDYVKKQINLRQEVHGKTERSIEELTYLNSRTSWIKLASGTSIEQSRLDMLPNLANEPQFLGLGLAEKFILFNGTTSISEIIDQQRADEILSEYNGKYKMEDFNDPQTLGRRKEEIIQYNPIQKQGFLGMDGAYFSGVGAGKYDFGIVPMPGIENVNVKSLEKGSIKRATIQLKVYNKQQFDIIDILYLRLGYTILLEWGDSHYLNNENLSNPVEKLRTTLLEKEFFKSSFATDYYNLLDTIEKERENYSGCYDALIGKITNFKWTFNPDGTYSITLDVLSLGDVIESLKLNVAPYRISSKKDQKLEEEEEIDLIDSSKDNNELSKMFYDIKTLSIQEEEGILSPLNTTIKVGVQTTRPVYKTYYPKLFIGRGVKVPPEYDFIFENLVLPEKRKLSEYVQIIFCEKKYQWFIRFGNLLESINKLLIHNLLGKTGQKYSSLKIDTNPETNLMYYTPNMVSLDPRICIIQNLEVLKPDGYVDKIFGGLNSFKTTIEGTNSSYGKIMNIYVNMNHVLELLSQTDKDGNIIFMDFLRNLCNDINRSLGKVNKLEPKVDPDTNIIKIFDQTPLPNKDKLPSNIYPTGSGIESPFDLYGYNVDNNTSNFIHNIGLTTEITPEYATMITVGSTSDGYVVGEESTAFSKWNNGIVDRFKESIEFETTPSGSISEKYLTIIENYYKLFKQTTSSDYTAISNSWYVYAGIRLEETVAIALSDGEESLEFIEKKYENFLPVYVNEKNISTNINIISEYYKMLQAKAVKNQNSNKSSGQTGFLPFNLQLDMDGISGMKIYQKIEVNSKFLPTNYPEKLEFVTTNIDHELSNNKWVTKLNSIATISNLLSTKDLENQLKINFKEDKILLQEVGKIDDIFRKRKNDYSSKVPYPDKNLNPVIIQDESQKIRYLKLYKDQLGDNFDNFIIRKGDDLNSYAIRFIDFLWNEPGSNNRITIKNASQNPRFLKPGELGNGADISEKLYRVLVDKLYPLTSNPKYSSILPIKITAGNDDFHQGKTLSSNAKYPTSIVTPANTTHTRGLAIDISSKGSIEKDNLIIEMLYEAGFGSILYHEPPHIHANIDPR